MPKATKPVRFESVDEPLDEEERALMDPDAWDWDNPVAVEVSPSLTTTLELRFSRDEIHTLSAAAVAANMPVTRFIKRAALAAAE
jgi:hypothetical protein